METVNNLTSAASRAIWGDPNEKTYSAQNEEPLSGKTRDASAEPTSAPSNTESADPLASSTTDANPTASEKPAHTTTTSSVPGHEASKTGVTAVQNPTSAFSNETSGAAVPDTQNERKATAQPIGSKVHERSDESTLENADVTYNQSTAIKADGGDFDAAKPGAGMAADRLIDTKHIHGEETPGSGDSSKSASKPAAAEAKDTSESRGKLSGLKEKIKAKLHKNKD